MVDDNGILVDREWVMYRDNDRVSRGRTMSNFLSTCKRCLDDFPTDELIWGDRGGHYWVCSDCYQADKIQLCGDHLIDIKTCGCKP